MQLSTVIVKIVGLLLLGWADQIGFKASQGKKIGRAIRTIDHRAISQQYSSLFVAHLHDCFFHWDDGQ